MPDADPDFVNQRQPIADDKFGKTRIHNGPQDPVTQYDIKKRKADLKKITPSEDQYTIVGGDGIHDPDWTGEDEEVEEFTNFEKLSLDPDTEIGTQVNVTDGFWVSGRGDATIDGFYWNDAPQHYISVLSNIQGGGVFYDSDAWAISNGNDTLRAAIGAEEFPWQANWSGLTPAITLTHPGLQQLAAASTAQGGVFVAGGTQDGLYPISGTTNGKAQYNPIGEAFAQESSIAWASGSSRWLINNGDPEAVYYSESAVATPDLASNWKNASDDNPASITVTSVSQGELDAGLKIGSDTYQVNGSENGRNKYSDVLGVATDVIWTPADDDHWTNGEGRITGNVAFPWQGTPELTVTRSDVASEVNWEVV